MKTIRIAAGQGFWGDWLEAPVHQVEDLARTRAEFERKTTGAAKGADYLVMDYLAEVTMSILQKQRARDPKAGYAKDFVPLMERILPTCIENQIRVVANAGGVNPRSCAEAVATVARKLDWAGRAKIGIVSGDDILDRLDEFLCRGIPLNSMDTGASLETIRAQVLSANVYFGAAPIVEALQQGAQVVITGRATDTGITLAPMRYEFGWAPDDWNKLAAGTIAGHTIECGAQCTGGNCQVDWEHIPRMEDPGYPVVEANEDGTFVITKFSNRGGRVTVAGIKEQLVYEMGDPRAYITPDCIADFTSIQLEPRGKDRVRFFGIRGRAATEFYKVSISYAAGYKAVGTLVYAWPDAYRKAQRADKILRARLNNLGLPFDEVLTEFVGADACHGPLAGESFHDVAEVQLRVGVRSQNKEAVERFTKEIAPLVLNGPPTVTGFAGGRPKVEEVVGYWPALIPKSEVQPQVSVMEV